MKWLGQYVSQDVDAPDELFLVIWFDTLHNFSVLGFCGAQVSLGVHGFLGHVGVHTFFGHNEQQCLGMCQGVENKNSARV